MNVKVDEILKGSFDLHVHASPDSRVERRADALQIARYAYEAEMAGFVLNSYEYPTAPMAYALQQMYPNLNATGSITLNKPVGGLNPDAVETSAGLGARVVWMPTIDAEASRAKHSSKPGLTITNHKGNLKPEINDILDIIRAHDMVLGSGHISPSEAICLFTEAKNKGITRMLATHPKGVYPKEEQRVLASLGAHLEYTFLSYMPKCFRSDMSDLVHALRDVDVGSCIITTGFGQWMNPPAAEGMRMAIATLLHAGMDSSEVSTLVKHNPLQLVS